MLDLCSRYDSHLPEIVLECVVGHGMCEPGLKANPLMQSFFIQDLNETPSLNIEDGTLDCVLCCMGLQYLKFPEDICHEVHRVLKPNGKFLVSFTTHGSQERTIAGWLRRTPDQRVELVKKQACFVA